MKIPTNKTFSISDINIRTEEYVEE